MAAKSIVDMALGNIDAQIADLQRAKELILAASSGESGEAPKAKRGRKKKAGLPAEPSL